MEKSEIERMLLDPEALKRLGDVGQAIDREIGIGRAPTKPATSIRPVGPSPSAIRATAEQVRANDLENVQRRGLLADIGRTFPELAGETPQGALSALTDRFRNDPSDVNQFLVQDAINRLTHVGELDQVSKRLVSSAIEALTSARPSEESGAEDSIYSNLFEHSDFRGRSIFAFLGPGSFYHSIRKSFLGDVDLHDRISSLTLDATTGESRGDIVLFQNDRFFGRFTQIRTSIGDPTQQVAATYVGSHINDRTSSLLLVRRYSDERLRALGDPISRALIGNIVGDIEDVKELRGDPIFTWDMWPTGGDEHPNDPDKKFIQVKIPIRVDVNNWLDYDATIWLWFYLYIGFILTDDIPPRLMPGGLRGYLAYYGCWVEGGILSGGIADRIMAAIPDRFGEIDALLDSLLSVVNSDAPFSGVYFLPGDQSLFNGMALEGNVEDNVTVVLTKPTAPENALARVGLV
jgi:hypothetical protein